MKEKLLYASPFPPKKSGIADYSEALVYGLRDYYDITLLVDGYRPENSRLCSDFTVVSPSQPGFSYDRYPLRLYNIGNNPGLHSYLYDAAVSHPGFVILHDYILYYLVVGHFGSRGVLYPKLYELGGAGAVAMVKPLVKQGRDLLSCKELAPRLALNREIITAARGLFVHSRHTEDRLRSDFPGAAVCRVNMVSIAREMTAQPAGCAAAALGIPPDAFVMASFGFIAETKLNDLVCRAVISHNRRSERKIYYVMVGEGGAADQYLCSFIVKTGFVERDVYEAVLQRCDLVANLRHPTMGESSVSLIHAMALSKACIVTDEAWFSELPDSAVVKLPVHAVEEELAAVLGRLLSEPGLLERTGSEAGAYAAREHRLGDIVGRMHEFISAVSGRETVR